MTTPVEPGQYDVNHLLMVWGGLLPGGETWSCSLRFAEQGNPGGGAQVPPRAEVEAWNNGAIKDAVLAYHTRPATRIASYARLSFVKLNRIDSLGQYIDQITNQYIFPDTAGGAAHPGQPNQNTLCISLTTGFSRGYGHRGRFYLPAPAVQIDTATGLFGAGAAGEIRDSTVTFLEALADVPGLDSPVSMSPAVMSRNRFGGAHRMITGVEVGRVVDTQRRRRRSLPENYERADLDLGAA